MKKGFLLILGCSLGLLPLYALAQVEINIPYALSNELNVEIIPTYPRPNESVFINLTMYTADLDSAVIAWYKEGKQILIGTGLKEFTFVVGDSGKETNIEVRIRLQNGTIFSKKFTLTPTSVTLMWEADSYVPPFYKGKALHPRQGRLKIVAMPEFVKNGKILPAKNLVYEWSDGLNVYQNQSGYGRNVLVLDGSLLGKTEKIELLVRDPANNLAAETFLDIPTSDPEIVFYQNDPYYGYLFDSAVPSLVNLVTDEIQLIASPYFITKENSSNLQYNWRLNGRAAAELEGSRTVVFRRPEGEDGQSTIKLTVTNLNKILQFTDKSLTIQFDE